MEKLSECMARNKIVMTRQISYDMEYNGEFAEEVAGCLKRHFNNDFGDLCDDDIELNLNAIENDLETDRVLSKYDTSLGTIYIISELYYLDNQDIVTTILYSNEY